MGVAGVDLFDQNASKVCSYVRLRCIWISLVLIYLIKMWVYAYANVRLRCTWISLVLIYLIKARLSVHGYY